MYNGQTKKKDTEEDEEERLARQHALVSAPWKNRKFWRDSAKDELKVQILEQTFETFRR